MKLGNSIAILATRPKQSRGLEFRVARIQTLEEIYREPDYPHVTDALFNKKAVLGLFQSSPVFVTAKRAETHAKLLECQIIGEGAGVIQCDIHRIDFGRCPFPVSEKQHWRRERERRQKIRNKRKHLQHVRSFYRHLRWPAKAD